MKRSSTLVRVFSLGSILALGACGCEYARQGQTEPMECAEAGITGPVASAANQQAVAEAFAVSLHVSSDITTS